MNIIDKIFNDKNYHNIRECILSQIEQIPTLVNLSSVNKILHAASNNFRDKEEIKEREMQYIKDKIQQYEKYKSNVEKMNCYDAIVEDADFSQVPSSLTNEFYKMSIERNQNTTVEYQGKIDLLKKRLKQIENSNLI